MKKGAAAPTLTDAHTFTGGIELKEGTLALDPGASFADSTLTMSDGATLKLKFTPGVGFATTKLMAAVATSATLPTSPTVTIEIDASAGLPEEGTAYTLFAGGLDAAQLNRIAVVPNSLYSLAVADGGAVTITLQHVPVMRTWTGGGADEKWTTTGNWDTDAALGSLDSVVFGGAGSHSIYDGADELPLASVTVESGVHTANVASACFSGAALSVVAGAEFALQNASGAVNPFSTEMGTNAIAGVLDLGGASQTISTAFDATGAFCDGGEIRNGTVTVVPSSWGLFFDNTAFTAGPGADFTSANRFYFESGANFKIDGGSFTNTSEGGNHVVGAGTSGSYSTLEVSNGGRPREGGRRDAYGVREPGVHRRRRRFGRNVHDVLHVRGRAARGFRHGA